MDTTQNSNSNPNQEGDKQPPAERTVKVRLLRDCSHGKCNAVVPLPKDVAAAAVKDGDADDTKAAVAFAESAAKAAAEAEAARRAG